jgi:hypothetical protein
MQKRRWQHDARIRTASWRQISSSGDSFRSWCVGRGNAGEKAGSAIATAIEVTMLTKQELETCQRLRLGIESIAAAVQRLNDLGSPLRVPPIAIRFQPSPLIHGENPYSVFVASMVCEEHMRRIELVAQPERLAA